MYFQTIALLAGLLLSNTLAMAPKSLHDASVHARHQRGSLNGGLGGAAIKSVGNTMHPRDTDAPDVAPTQPASSTDGSSSSGSIAMASSAMITTACMDALSSITNVTNLAGLAACYNVPFFNNATGLFQADLRLYQISPPSGLFQGVTLMDISLVLNYPDGVISSASEKIKRDDTSASQNPFNATSEIQQFPFVGQIKKSLNLSKLQASDLMALLIPTIRLDAFSPTSNTSASTNLTDASTVYFVAGVFAGQGDTAAAAASPSAASAAAQRGAAFVLPGMKIAIFPIGFIITGAWAALFFVTVGFGTIERMRFRDNYRERVKAAAATRSRKT